MTEPYEQDTLCVVDYGRGVKAAYSFTIIDSCDPSPDMTGSYNHESSIECPVCHERETCCIVYEIDELPWPNGSTDAKQACWYCRDCFTVFQCNYIGGSNG